MDSPRSRERIIDSSLNRAAEGLRVVEDICRFHWSFPGFAEELKALRHELLAAGRGDLETHRRLLRSRDVEGDVGRRSGVTGPTGRTGPPETAGPPADGDGAADASLAAAAFANLERSREALRTLEEVTRDADRELAGRFESLRYRLYSLEKGLARAGDAGDGASRAGIGAERRARLQEARIYLLATRSLCSKGLAETVTTAVRAGVDVVQLREKSLSAASLLDEARALREITAREGALLVVNDRPDVALLSRADGVHLGQEDLAVGETRAVVGDDLIIGVSTHSVEQARKAQREGADYIGAGPVFPTATKDAGPAIGPEGLERILAAVDVPAFAIGGIGPRNAHEVAARGAARVAVSSAILGSDDVQAAVRALRRALER